MSEMDFEDFLNLADFATRKNFNEFSEFMECLPKQEKGYFIRKLMEYTDKNNPDLNLLNHGYDSHKIVSLDPHRIQTRGKYIFGLVSLIRMFMISLIFAEIAQNYGDIIYLVNCTKSISAFLQGLCKAIPIFMSPNHLIYIRLITITRVWFKPLSKTEEEYYNFWRKIILTYKYTAYVLYSLMLISSTLYESLFFEVYIPDFPYSIRFLAFLQYFELAIDLLLVIGIDMIFVACCVLIWRQTEMLIQEFTSIDGKSGYEETMKHFKRCVVHHDFLLDYVNCVISTFKLALLLQYVISVLGLCIDLYLLTENPTLVELSQSVLYLGMLVCQIGLYCFMADMTCEKVEAIPKFLLNTNWYNNPLYLNKLYVTVLCRSQKEVSFTAGGMVKINKEGFTSMFKTTLSFYTLVRQMKDEQ